MKILNLYSCIGGNRKLWEGHEITAVEIDEKIAKVYQEHFPNDNVIVTDAHQYLLDHYKDFDFIWSSPPCPTHSDIRRCGVHAGQYEALYPDMQLYQEIILLRHFAPKKTKWVVENVKPYYKPLVPAQEIHRHLFWTNFWIAEFETDDDRKHDKINGSSTVYGFNIKNTDIENKRRTLRDMVDLSVGKHVLDCAMGNVKQKTLI